jgi:hypothetical protein
MIKSRRIRWAWHVARLGKKRNACKILMGKPEGKRPLGRTRRSLVDSIKIGLKKVRRDWKDLIDLALDRDRRRALMNTIINLRVP